MMTTRKWELIKGSPLACFILAFTLLGFDIWAVCYNIYNASGGYVSNLTELLAYFGEDEIIISIMGIVSFVVFMWLGVNGAKPDDEEDADMVTCYLHAPHIENYLNAEEYVKYYLADCSDVKEEDKKIEQTILHGKLYYYILSIIRMNLESFRICVRHVMWEVGRYMQWKLTGLIGNRN